MTPTLSVEAVHDRLIWLALAAVAVKLDGAVGGVVSTAEGDAEKAAICATQVPPVTVAVAA